MKYLFSVLSVLLFASCFSQNKNDSTTIVQLLKSDYATMDNMDLQAHINNVTNDYLLIEHGDVWDINTELDSIYRKNINKTFKRTDFFDIKLVKISGDMAYAVWHLRSEYNDNGNIRSRVWNESGAFRKEQGHWKIALIHSTPERQK
jgi:ketosteroid isomerase-like protein